MLKTIHKTVRENHPLKLNLNQITLNIIMLRRKEEKPLYPCKTEKIGKNYSNKGLISDIMQI